VNGVDDICSALATGDVIVVFPTLEKMVDYYNDIASTIKEHHSCGPRATRTAFIFDMRCYGPRILRLWTPHFLIGEEPTLPMDYREDRKGFEPLSPYFTRRELRRLV